MSDEKRYTFGDSSRGKSAGRIDKVVEILMKRRAEPDESERPLLGEYMQAFVDPHGEAAKKLMSRLAGRPASRLCYIDLNDTLKVCSFDPFGLRIKEDDTGFLNGDGI